MILAVLNATELKELSFTVDLSRAEVQEKNGTPEGDTL